MKNFSIRAASMAAFFTGALCSATIAGPITTVPWNGYVGAVSFTFDDALTNQIQNLKPILDEMPDVKVTFFVTSMGNGLKSNVAGYAALAKSGHEIGNHTDTHGHPTGLNESELESEITNFAKTIESTIKDAGAEIDVVSFAAPFCETNESVHKVIDKSHFVNRNCGWYGRNNWGTEPDWMNIQAKIWTRSGANVDEMLSAMDTAAFIGDFGNANPWDVSVTEGTWLVVLNHGVTDDTGDDYAINPGDIKKIIQHACDNKLWTASFGTVAAYYRAHFVMDAAESVNDGEGFSVSWKIPHEHMPKSVPLRVNIKTDIENAVVEQDGKVIKPESDGTFIVEFMAQSLKVRKGDGSASADTASTDTSAADTSKPLSVLSKVDFSTKNGNYTFFDLNGNLLGRSTNFEIPANFPKGAYVVRAQVNGKTATKLIRK